MAIRYEYWRHVLTGDIYAVKLDDARVIGACLMDRHEAHEELLPLLLYLDKHVADVERDRRYFSRYEHVKRYSGRSSFSTSPAFAVTALTRHHPITMRASSLSTGIRHSREMTMRPFR